MDRMGDDEPVPDDRISVKTTYAFERGDIKRTDVYTPSRKFAMKGITMSFGSFSSEPATNGLTTKFPRGDLEEFSVSGMDKCESAPAAGDVRYLSTTGPMASKVVCSRGAFELSRPITLSWRIRYQPQRSDEPTSQLSRR